MSESRVTYRGKNCQYCDMLIEWPDAIAEEEELDKHFENDCIGITRGDMGMTDLYKVLLWRIDYEFNMRKELGEI